jgi:hypothetical protein
VRESDPQLLVASHDRRMLDCAEAMSIGIARQD